MYGKGLLHILQRVESRLWQVLGSEARRARTREETVVKIITGGAARDASFRRQLVARSGQATGSPYGVCKVGLQNSFLRGGKTGLLQYLLSELEAEMVALKTKTLCRVAAKSVLPGLLELETQTLYRSGDQVNQLALMVSQNS